MYTILVHWVCTVDLKCVHCECTGTSCVPCVVGYLMLGKNASHDRMVMAMEDPRMILCTLSVH